MGPFMLIFPFGTLLKTDDLSTGNTLGDPTPLIHLSNEILGENAGLMSTLLTPDRSNSGDGLILGLIPKNIKNDFLFKFITYFLFYS